MGGKSLTLINLQPSEVRPRDRPEPLGDQALDAAVKSANIPKGPLSLREFEAQAALYSPKFEKEAVSKIRVGKAAVLSDAEVIPHKTGGRWCRCVDAIKA